MPVISPDGRYVLFASTANNLVLTPGNAPIPFLAPASINVYLRDRASNVTTLVSVNLTESGGGNGDSIPTALSTNGQYALFESAASDLIPNDTNNAGDIFVRDVIGKTTSLVSANTNGVSGNGVSRSSVMTPDGRYVAFVSAATDLVPGDTNNIPDVFVRDVVSNVTTLVSVGAISTNLYGRSFSEAPAISSDGRYVAFLSTATNLIPGLSAAGDIYVRDLVSQSTFWASTNARVMAQAVMGTSNIVSCNLSLSADGAYVAFEVVTNSNAFAMSGLILRHNVPSGVTGLVAANANVSAGPLEAIRSLEMTADARFIAFVGNVGNALPLTNSAIYLWDAQTGTNVLVSADQTTGQPAIGMCSSPALSADGRYVAFVSSGTNLVTNPMSGDYHAYVRDTRSGTTVLADVALDGTGAGVGAMIWPALSADGQLLAFETYQTNLVATDQNSNDDVFVFTPGTAGMEWLSVNDPSLFGSGPTISWQTNGLQTCQMQFNSDLSDTNWQNAIGSITTIGKQAHFTDLAPGPVQRFYRVVAY